jgi:streptogramin lyase
MLDRRCRVTPSTGGADHRNLAVHCGRNAAWLESFEPPVGAGPHDVAPAADGGIWCTAQRAGYLGHLD